MIPVSLLNLRFCDNLGDPRKECTWTPVQIQRYRSRLSSPLLDRIDFHVEVPPVRVADIERPEPGESSGEIKKRVNVARRI